MSAWPLVWMYESASVWAWGSVLVWELARWLGYSLAVGYGLPSGWV